MTASNSPSDFRSGKIGELNCWCTQLLAIRSCQYKTAVEDMRPVEFPVYLSCEILFAVFLTTHVSHKDDDRSTQQVAAGYLQKRASYSIYCRADSVMKLLAGRLSSRQILPSTPSPPPPPIKCPCRIPWSTRTRSSSFLSLTDTGSTTNLAV